MKEFRKGSYGGLYYFVERAGEILPIRAVAKELSSEPTSRGPVVQLSVELAEEDYLIEVNFSRSAKTIGLGKEKASNLKGIDQQKWRIPTLSEEDTKRLLTSKAMPTRMKKQILKCLKRES